MPYRKTPLVTGYYYHIYNRGTEKRRIFEDRRDFNRFLKTLSYYQLKGPKPKLSHFFKYQNFKPETAKKIVDILVYCFMPNHFHLILKQSEDNSITEVLSKLSLSYTKYFNTKKNRVGPLFQGEFQSKLIESDKLLLHISRYIHLNPVVAGLSKTAEDYEWSSAKEYKSNTEGLCYKQKILDLVGGSEKYFQFIEDQIGYARELDFIKHLTFEDNLA